MTGREAQKVGRILVVAGSDPTSGAGLQADLKTITALGGYALTAVTAVTVQDSAKVHRVVPLNPELVQAQIEAVLGDIGADVIKIGMLATPGIVEMVADLLDRHADLPVIADPVLAGTGGGTLLDGPGLDLFREKLLPRLTLITPNLSEAARLTGLPVDHLAQMKPAAQKLATYGCSVLITGGHLPGEEVVDLLQRGTRSHSFSAPRLPGAGFHGTGCVLTSAIAAGMAGGLSLEAAVELGRKVVRNAIIQSLPLGGGQRLLNVEDLQD
ncbi:MAG: bifunctional hydroxymethylpyrimidine kinase/phosphomethylpyrimidine kinase [Magnetococcales bacterium]|nr:bifunctional hydroxymethylpyrimidine kinase/phosphomethylpyrimidine kinase [Magnetococcales bacterium]